MKHIVESMISNRLSICPECDSKLKYYDKVTRTVVIKGGERKSFKIRRFKCYNCGKTYRELPDFIYPYKHYDSEIIKGVKDGLITSETIGYEDYPCSTTMNRWLRSKFDSEFACELYF